MIYKRNDLTEAVFIKRLNRFVSQVKLNHKIIEVYVPNTGRLSELAIPGNKVLLKPYEGKFNYKMIYIYDKSFPVMIDSANSNKIFYSIMGKNLIPDLKNHKIIKSEPTHENSRFDFLLSDGKNESLIEIKSCTLIFNKIASFPDAISGRASKHIKSLAQTNKGKLFILILYDDVKIFIPNYHTDFTFYTTLKENMNKIDIMAFSITYNQKLEIQKLKKVPIHIPEVTPQGSYFLILYNNEKKTIDTGSMGKTYYREGYYIYINSDNQNVFKKIQRHRRIIKNSDLHIDYVIPHMKIITDIPIIGQNINKYNLADNLKIKGGIPITGFESNNSEQNSLLHFFKENPVEQKWFWDLILSYRFSQYSENF